jgi:hypothetical protein
MTLLFAQAFICQIRARVHAFVECNLHAKGCRPKPNGLEQDAVENWREIVRTKIGAVSFEQTLDDLWLFIGSS